MIIKFCLTFLTGRCYYNFMEIVLWPEMRRQIQDLNLRSSLDKALKRIIDLESPLLIALFGSLVESGYRKGSDIDLLVIYNSSISPRQKRERIMELTRPLTLHSFPYSQSEFTRLLELKNAFAMDVEQKGVLIYHRDPLILP